MAKSGFWLRGAKGKLAGTVLYQSQGSTVQREIVTPKNPQSDNQMRQRAAFAGASKFYQNAQQNRFVLAFQNKKGNQSEFNAFMQKNLKEFDTLTYPTREMANTPEFCNFFPWICTEGNLQSIPAAFPDDGASYLGCGITGFSTSGALAKNWDELIANNPALNLQYGDIITVTIVLNDEVFDDTTLNVVTGNIAPRWITRQFIIGADLDGYTLEMYLEANGFVLDGLSDPQDKNCISINMDDICQELVIADEFNTQNVAAMVCVTRSRNEGSQLKVSTSRFALDDMAQRIFERLSNDSAIRDAIESYKNSANSNITPANILQGSVAVDIPVSDLYYRNSSGDTAHASAPATDVSAEAVVGEGKATAVFEIYGITKGELVKAANVSALANGWNFAIESTSKRIQGSHTMTKWEGAKITFSKTGTTAGSTPFQIKYNGVEVASGNIVVGA